MTNCRSNHTFENWAHTLKFKPASFCQPESEADVVAIVKDAVTHGATVRTQGAGHSWSGFVVTDAALVQLDKLNKGLVADIPHQRYTVQAGIRLKDLIHNLALDGLALKNLGSITEQSIAGAISTGTHGTGQRLGNLSSFIVGMKLVTGTGDVVTVTDVDTDLLDAVRVSIGALGIITEVTIDCVPIYDLEYTAYLCKFSDVVDKLATLNQENERVRLWWLVPPIGPKDNVILTTMNPPGTAPGLLGQGGTSSSTGDPFGMDTNDLVSLILNVAPSGPFHPMLKFRGRYDRILTIPLLPVFHRECEYAIPTESASDALKAFRRIFEEGDMSTTLPVEVRFVAKDNSFMSPASGRDVCYIGVSTQPNSTEVFERVEPIMRDLKGRPHWGKCFTLQRSDVMSMYPDSYATFCAMRQQMDPDRVFGNTLVRRLFD
jgi:FAD/FMN-containing dehydrogenase